MNNRYNLGSEINDRYNLGSEMNSKYNLCSEMNNGMLYPHETIVIDII